MEQIVEFLLLIMRMALAVAVPILLFEVRQLIVSGIRLLVQRAAVAAAGLTSNQRWEIQQVITLVTRAAEQSGLANLIQNTGAAKKEHAIAAAQAILDSRGINISLAEIDAEIESAILLGLQKPNELVYGLPKVE